LLIRTYAQQTISQRRLGERKPRFQTANDEQQKQHNREAVVEIYHPQAVSIQARWRMRGDHNQNTPSYKLTQKEFNLYLERVFCIWLKPFFQLGLKHSSQKLTFPREK